jgi:hypothetical protein
MLPRLLYAAVALCLLGALPVAHPARGAPRAGAAEGPGPGHLPLAGARTDVVGPAGGRGPPPRAR